MKEELTPKPKVEELIEEIPYEEEWSPEFDAHLRTREVTVAQQDSMSEPTREKIIYSKWHTPCHDIITQLPDGTSQIFHVQPNKMSASLLSFEQEKGLKSLTGKNAKAITVKGGRSWLAVADIQELERMGIAHERTIEADTPDRWQLLYDPVSNEIWIDNPKKKVLRKYKGF